MFIIFELEVNKNLSLYEFKVFWNYFILKSTTFLLAFSWNLMDIYLYCVLFIFICFSVSSSFYDWHLLVGPYLAVTCLLSLLSVWLVMIRLRKGLLAITYISCFLILQIFGQVPIHHLSRACFSIIYIRSYLASSFIFIVVTGRILDAKLCFASHVFSKSIILRH